MPPSSSSGLGHRRRVPPDVIVRGDGTALALQPFGRGHGDLFARFRWTTPVDGRPPPVPEAWLSVLADHDGEVDSYGVEHSVTNLASSLDQVSTHVTVTAADGKQYTFEPTPASVAPGGATASKDS